MQNLRPRLNTLLLCFLFACMLTIFISLLALQPARLMVASFWVLFVILLLAYLSQYPRLGFFILITSILVGLGFVLPKPVAVWVLDYPNALLDYFGFAISAGKIFHVIVYGFLGAGYVVLLKEDTNLSSKIILTAALLVAMVMSEVFQLFVPNRSSSVKDISYNAIGIVIGAVLVLCGSVVSRVYYDWKQARSH